MRVTAMSAPERKGAMASISDNFEKQENPKAGIFWHDAANDELFGITAVDADELSFNDHGMKTVGAYTQVPRGGIFELMCGSLTDEHIVELIKGGFFGKRAVGSKDRYPLGNWSWPE